MNNESTYYYANTSARNDALRALEIVRKRERLQEELVKQGKLRKVVTYDPTERLTTIRYVKR